MLSARLTQLAVRAIDRIAPHRAAQRPAHLIIGRRGEEDAYFYLRRKGYVMVARNYRTARLHGEVDLIGWDKDVLCFIEVKTRTTRDVKPAEAAVDRKKRHDLKAVIREYLRTLPRKQYSEVPPWRFDVITVYYEQPAKRSAANAQPNSSANAELKRPDHCAAPPTFELFQNATLSS